MNGRHKDLKETVGVNVKNCIKALSVRKMEVLKPGKQILKEFKRASGETQIKQKILPSHHTLTHVYVKFTLRETTIPKAL